MSTIHQAFKKKTSGSPDFAAELTAMDRISLFPVPDGQQRAEFIHLANMLLDFKPANRGAVIAFASSVSGEGASFVSYNTARQLAHVMNRSVAWIDANFHSPQRKLAVLGDITLAEMLREPERFAHLPGGVNLTLVPGGVDLDGCASDLASERSPALLKLFSQKFDFTVVDCPPILGSVETELLAARSDGLVVVVERRRLKREIIRSGLEHLASKRVNVLGTVFNRRSYELPKLIYDRL